MKRRLPARATQRAVAAWQSFASLGTANPLPMPKQPSPSKPRAKRGKQPESLVNKANQQWARLKGGSLRRNRLGFAEIRQGVKVPFGLGIGTLDLVGPMPVLITADMVGRTMAIYCEIESKTDTGVVAPHQQQRVDELRAMGAMSGVARNPDDCEAILANWREKK